MLVRRHLLCDAAAAARWQPMFDALPPGLDDDEVLAQLARDACARWRSLPWPLDVAVLGIGEDGHTASLFCGAQGLDEALRSPGPVAWTRPRHAPHARLTLTLPTLLAARHLILPLRDSAKQAVYARACAAPSEQLPISLVLHRAPRAVHVWTAQPRTCDGASRVD